MLDPILTLRTAYWVNSTATPSQGYLESTKCVLRYLKHTSFHGIWFKQGENWLHGSVDIPKELKGNDLMVFTDSSWGPQDVSKPKPNKTRTVTMEELKLIQGFYITRMGVLCIGVFTVKRGEIEVHVWPKSIQSMMEFVLFSIYDTWWNN